MVLAVVPTRVQGGLGTSYTPFYMFSFTRGSWVETPTRTSEQVYQKYCPNLHFKFTNYPYKEIRKIELFVALVICKDTNYIRTLFPSHLFKRVFCTPCYFQQALMLFALVYLEEEQRINASKRGNRADRILRFSSSLQLVNETYLVQDMLVATSARVSLICQSSERNDSGKISCSTPVALGQIVITGVSSK